MKQTALEWFIQEFEKEPTKVNLDRLNEQAKEMEKQQIIEFADYCVELQYHQFKTGEEIKAETMEELLEQFNK